MTSESDSTPRRPPTIDLSATEIDAEPAAASKSDSGAEHAKADAGAPRNFGFPAGAAVAGGTTAVAVMAAVGYGLWLAGYLPPHQFPAPQSSASPAPVAASDTTGIAQLSNQLSQIEAAVQSRQPDAALTSRLADAEAVTKSQADSLAALGRRLDEVAATAQSALAQAKAASAAAENAASSAGNAAKAAVQASAARDDLDALDKRIAALESAVKSLSGNVARQTSSANDRIARSIIAAEALRAAVERGASYEAELAAVKSVESDDTATAPLQPFAASGLPTAPALAQELAALVPAMRRAVEPVTNDASLLDRLESHAQQLVRITPIDAPAGRDPQSVIASISADAARTDIAAALTDLAKLPPNIKAIADGWIKKVEARNAALTASRHLAATALAALGRPAPQ